MCSVRQGRLPTGPWVACQHFTLQHFIAAPTDTMLPMAALPDPTIPNLLPHFFQIQKAQLLFHQAVPETL